MLESPYHLVKISRQLLCAANGSRADELIDTILNYWSSLDDFFWYGIGYVVQYEQQFVTSCFSGFAAGNLHGISIETAEAHRGKKLAQAAARAFVNDCLSSGKSPYWDCTATNLVSNRVARNIGLTLHFDYNVYGFRF